MKQITVKQYTTYARDARRVDVTFPVVSREEFLEIKKNSVPTSWYEIGAAAGAPRDGLIERGVDRRILSKIGGRYYRILRRHGGHGAMVPEVATEIAASEVSTEEAKTALGNTITRHYFG